MSKYIRMSATAEKLWNDIQTWNKTELLEMCQRVIHLASHLDYGDIPDETLIHLAAESFSQLDQEEADAPGRR